MVQDQNTVIDFSMYCISLKSTLSRIVPDQNITYTPDDNELPDSQPWSSSSSSSSSSLLSSSSHTRILTISNSSPSGIGINSSLFPVPTKLNFHCTVLAHVLPFSIYSMASMICKESLLFIQSECSSTHFDWAQCEPFYRVLPRL